MSVDELELCDLADFALNCGNVSSYVTQEDSLGQIRGNYSFLKDQAFVPG